MIQFTKDTIKVRKGEEISIEPLESFLRKNLSGIPFGKLEIEQFSAGHSNLTYLLKIKDWEAVLRRPPLGPVAPQAHDMEREYKVISYLDPLFPEAPKPYLFSSDTNIVGSTFYIMERKKGIVLDTELPKGLTYSKKIGRNISEQMVDLLVKLHNINYKETSFNQISSPKGFLKRQVNGWIARYERAKTENLNEVEQLKKWLEVQVPVSQEPTIIHYDFKLNNAMFSKDLSKIIGLFDWEMATIGDPLADVGAAMSYWIEANDPDLLKKVFEKPPLTTLDGFYTRNEFIESYANKSGRDMDNIQFYITFAYFKLAVICQQIYYRYKKGQTNDSRFAHLNKTANNLIKFALFTANNK